MGHKVPFMVNPYSPIGSKKKIHTGNYDIYMYTYNYFFLRTLSIDDSLKYK